VGTHRDAAAELIFLLLDLNRPRSCGVFHFWRAAIDRQIFYPSEVLDDTDLLSVSKNPMVGLGYALLDILGAAPAVSGFPCTQTTVASLAVLVGAGRIYSLQTVDGTAYGSLPADTTDQIIKQGIQLGSVTLATPAPATAGQSINYLIEASYQDLDTTLVVPPFFNSSNPQVPFSGQNNNGAPLPTQRKGTVVLQAKAGAAAATGSQATPAPDAGFVGLYVVTVANGQATVTAANIVTLQSAPFLPANIGSPMVSTVLASAPFSTTSTALANTGIGMTLPVGTYAIEMLLNITGITTGTQGVKLALGGTAVEGTGTANEFTLGPMIGSIDGAAVNASFPANASFATISVSTILDFLLIKFAITVSQAGTFVLQAAQNSASANATRLTGYMTATPVA
jgi:hypothetical protein